MLHIRHLRNTFIFFKTALTTGNLWDLSSSHLFFFTNSCYQQDWDEQREITLRNNTCKFFVTCAIISSTILIINIYRFLQFFCHCIGLVNHRNHLYQVFLQQQFICKNHQLILDYDFEETNIIFLSQNDIKERLLCWHCSDFKKTFKQLFTVSWNI